MEEEAFQRLYGPWRPWTPAGAAAALAGWDRPWWLVGGWAIDAATGTARHHEDLDIGILRRDAPALRAHLSHLHCWAVGSGALRPVTDEEPELPDWAGQLWLREHALAPWLVDVVLAPDRDGDWVFRRDPSVVLPLDRVLRRGPDGVAFQRPELVLAFKAAARREKDDADLDRAWPHLDAAARAWLRDTVARLHPGHPWSVRD